MLHFIKASTIEAQLNMSQYSFPVVLGKNNLIFTLNGLKKTISTHIRGHACGLWWGEALFMLPEGGTSRFLEGKQICYAI